jgi:hypothetical protein
MIFTSYFLNVKYITGKKPDLEFVSIAGKTPKWLEDSLIKIHKFKELMPKYEWWKIWHEKFKDDYESETSKKWYEEKYIETVLSKLNPNDTQFCLYDLSNRKNVILLCYETPEKFCHRHLVSKWFMKNGIMCRELDIGDLRRL